jgi:hypothetical protein
MDPSNIQFGVLLKKLRIFEFFLKLFNFFVSSDQEDRQQG